MPMPGAINSPVCWANGSGQDISYPTPSMTVTQQLACVSPCMYPWQTPIGVMAEAKTIKGAVQIQTVGEFRVPLTDIYPQNATDILAPTNLLGRRVYYDPFAGKYIVQEVFSETTSYGSPRPIYPGSATIGYVCDVSETDEDAGIMIDPRAPTATYAVGFALTSTTWSMGMPVTLDPVTNTIAACTSESTHFDGVVAGWLKPSLVPMPGADAMVIVTHGPTWYPINGTAFYSVSGREELRTYVHAWVPIDINGAASTLGNTEDCIIMGGITLDGWYYDELMPAFALLDVKRFVPETSTVTMLQPLS